MGSVVRKRFEKNLGNSGDIFLAWKKNVKLAKTIVTHWHGWPSGKALILSVKPRGIEALIVQLLFFPILVWA